MMNSTINPSYLSNITTATNASHSSSTHFIHERGERNCLKACHFNANSLRTRIEALRLFLSKSPLCNLIDISETKLGPIVEDAIVLLDVYALFRQDHRTNAVFVALYVHA